VKASWLADESLHIANAFQVAGFAHVIGSLWRVADDVSVRVVEIFYKTLAENSNAKFSNQSVASVLRSALLQVRSEFPDDPDLWAPFIHRCIKLCGRKSKVSYISSFGTMLFWGA
jgi:CHAT domain-containing protein